MFLNTKCDGPGTFSCYNYSFRKQTFIWLNMTLVTFSEKPTQMNLLFQGDRFFVNFFWSQFVDIFRKLYGFSITKLLITPGCTREEFVAGHLKSTNSLDFIVLFTKTFVNAKLESTDVLKIFISTDSYHQKRLLESFHILFILTW